MAWNGIRFMAPVNWQVGTIGTRYLMLEEESGPVLEIKWARIKGAFSHKAHLHRLATLHGRNLGKAVRESPLPPGWKKALGGYSAKAFSWHGKTVSGKGVILYCPTCQNATLIQFYHRDASKAENVSERLLASLRDHRQDNQVVWSVFDIRATIPNTFHLVRQRFEPGIFELEFMSKGQKVTLYRWGPASILLCDRDLVQFARAMLHISQVEPRSLSLAGRKAVEWNVTPPPSRWAHLWGRMKAKPSFQWYRLWHLEEKNCIFGVRIEGKRPLDTPFLDRICVGYESL